MAEPVDRFHIAATERALEDRGNVLKHDDTFVVLDRHGDIWGERGLFHQDTRYLSRLTLRLQGQHPLLLSSTVHEDNLLLTVDLTNSDVVLPSGRRLSHGAVHLSRSMFLWKAVWYERIVLQSFARDPAVVRLSLEIAADFADIFEVRGAVRERRGDLGAPILEDDGITYTYRGLDGRIRATHVRFSARPVALEAAGASFDIDLSPQHEQVLYVTYACEADGYLDASAGRVVYEAAQAERGGMLEAAYGAACEVTTSNVPFNGWLNRSVADLRMLLAQTRQGFYPHAGVPWYSTTFGRDGIITALQTLWIDPRIALGALSHLAELQSDGFDAARAAEPGKIVHEVRAGEMAATGEVPFARYYGTVDATPLFVVLAGAYLDQTGDADSVRRLWPSVVRALAWMDEHGDVDGDGFIEYAPDAHGLRNQGWKDSVDAVFHEDGRDAEGTIALCEVQAYAYAARLAGARLAVLFHEHERAEHLLRQAEQLRRHFAAAFFHADLGTFALALDGQKRACRVRTSNAGHCLFSGIATDEHAALVGQGLLSESFFSGWGIRTVASTEVRYNPMSYHNGSVWPHDNALIALGLSRYGHKPMAVRLLRSMFEASLFFDGNRLPELFCGFSRRGGQGPTLYPVACSPQAWAAGSVFALLSACLGMSIDAPNRRVVFSRPVLPPFLNEVELKNLRIGDASVDLILHRYPDDVGINVVRRRGRAEVVNIK